MKSFKKFLLKENVYKVYHGTNQKFNAFDFSKTAEGMIWFSDSIKAIKDGSAGADGTAHIIVCEIKLNKPAGWNEYESLTTDQLIQEGYDGVILPENGVNNYIVFHPESIISFKYLN